jgi:hypothetical protein
VKRDHRGIAARGGNPQAPVGHPADPDAPVPGRALCRTCGRPLSFRRRTYGPRGRAGGWTHRGDGLAQYRSWGGSK